MNYERVAENLINLRKKDLEKRWQKQWESVLVHCKCMKMDRESHEII